MGRVLYRELFLARVAKSKTIGVMTEGRVAESCWRKVGGGVSARRDLRMITSVMPVIPRFFCAPPCVRVSLPTVSRKEEENVRR